MQQRPPGIVLSAVALGLAALIFLLLGIVGMFSVIAGPHPPPGAPAASAAALILVSLAVTLLYLALAAWALLTLRGLWQMRPWARVSAMGIAGCMVGFGLLFAVGMTGAQSLLASGSVPLPPNINPATLHKALLVLAILCFVVAALGVAWLIYFASRSTRDAFLREQARQLGQTPQAAPSGYAAPVFPARRAAPPPALDPLTDFTIARPIEKRPEAAPVNEAYPQGAPSASPHSDEPQAP